MEADRGGRRRPAARDVLGLAGKRTATLKIDPRDGRLFYEVDTRRRRTGGSQWIDATTGHGPQELRRPRPRARASGVKGDTKTIDTTQQAGGLWQLVSADGRQLTYDAKNGTTIPGEIMTDPDNVWDTRRSRR